MKCILFPLFRCFDYKTFSSLNLNLGNECVYLCVCGSFVKVLLNSVKA